MKIYYLTGYLMEIGVVGDENHRGREHQSNEVKEEETENERRTGGGRRSRFALIVNDVECRCCTK